MQVAGFALCGIAVLWAWLCRHQLRIWRNTGHSAGRVAIVLELEDSVTELERLSGSIDSR